MTRPCLTEVMNTEKEQTVPNMTEFEIDDVFSILLGNESEREIESDNELEEEHE